MFPPALGCRCRRLAWKGCSPGPEAAAEIYYRLKCAAGNHDAYLSPIGITFDEFLNNDTNTGERNFLTGQDLETVAHAGFTGEDFGGGRAFLLDVKNCGDGTDLPSRCASQSRE